MNIDILSEILNTMYENAPKDSKVLNIYLFGIRYGKKINSEKYSIEEILDKAKVDVSFKEDLIMGIRLSDHAEIVPK